MFAAIQHPFGDPPAQGQAVAVAEGVLWLRLPLPMALNHVNCYALDDGAGWTLVDTGMYNRRSTEIWQALLDGPLAGKPVTRLLVTHHHPDHIGLAGWFQARGVELVIPRTAWLYARMLCLDDQHRPSPESMAFYTRAGLSAAQLAVKSTERPFNFCDVVAPLPLGFTRLHDDQVFRAGGRDWRVRFGHGHAPDHATLWSLDDNLVIGGDQLLPGISANIGVFPTEPEADPLGDWLHSCQSFIPLASDAQLVLPGHKTPFTGLPFRLPQMIENHHAALSRLVAHLAQPRLATDCFLALFKRDLVPAEQGLALAETLAHLNYLLRRGAVLRSLTQQGAWAWQARME